jgi:signal transduction histidine kinase
MTRPRSAESVLVRRAALQLGLQGAVFASTIVVLLVATAVAVVVTSQRHAATALLNTAVSGADDVTDPPTGIWLVMRTPTGTTTNTVGLPAGLPDTDAIDRVAAGGPGDTDQDRINGIDYQVQTLRQNDQTIVQGVLDLSTNHTERDQLIALLLGVGGVGLGLAAVGGTWLGHRALRPLSAALVLQRRFVADAGHELRTPVTLLSTRAQLLRRRLRHLEPTTQSALGGEIDALIGDSARLGDILEDLLLAADPLASHTRESVELVELAHAVLATAAAQAAQRGIRLTGPPPATGPIPVPGSPVALRRALTALLDNALRHARHHVTITVRTDNHHALIDVIDDGPGIDPDLAPRLFERFVSGGAGPTHGRRRYGLGLAVVNEIATAHGGRVELLHQPPPGAALRLQLPRDKRVYLANETPHR